MSNKYWNAYKAYEVTASTVASEEVRASLCALGYELGEKTIKAQHTELKWWLTSHGLDVTRSDLDQQALINDNSKLVKSYVSARRAKKRDNMKIGKLQNALQAAGITITDDKRLERCLQITADKAKAHKRHQSKIRRAGGKHRDKFRGDYVDAKNAEFFATEYDRMLECLVLNGATSEADADATLHAIYTSYADGKHDIHALDAAFEEALDVIIAEAESDAKIDTATDFNSAIAVN